MSRLDHDQRAGELVLEQLEPRLLLSCAYDLDVDSFIGTGDDAIFAPAWHSEGGYAFTDSLTADRFRNSGESGGTVPRPMPLV